MMIIIFFCFVYMFIFAAIFWGGGKLRRKPRVFKPVSLESGEDVRLQSSEAYEL